MREHMYAPEFCLQQYELLLNLHVSHRLSRHHTEGCSPVQKTCVTIPANIMQKAKHVHNDIDSVYILQNVETRPEIEECLKKWWHWMPGVFSDESRRALF